MTIDFNKGSSLRMPQDVASRMQDIIRKHADGYRSDLPGLVDQMHLLVKDFARNSDMELLATLQREAHDMKGQAATFGMPGISAVANSLSRMLDANPKASAELNDALETHVLALKQLLEHDDPAIVEATIAIATPFL